MPGIVGIGAHVEGADVQQVSVVAGRIGEPPTKITPPLGEENMRRHLRQTHEVDGEQGAGETGSDDADAAVPLNCSHRL